jgi:Ca-activated chloride channel family protein
MHRRLPSLVLTALCLVVSLAAPAGAQREPAAPPGSPDVIVPQIRWHPVPEHAPHCRVTAIGLNILIEDQISSTTMEMTITNPSGRPQEAQLLIPTPDGATIRSLEYDGVGPEPTAKVLRREEARGIYNAIVNRLRDPALVEFAGYNLIRTSAFPIPAGGSQKLKLTYEQVLAADGQRVDYFFPRSESLDAGAGSAAWTVAATIKSKRPISTVFSSSHEIMTERLGPGHVLVKLAASAAANPGSLRLSYLLGKQEDDAPAATLLAYPDPKSEGGQGGYFLLIAGLPPAGGHGPDRQALKREVTVVIDRSGSMQGAKIKQVRLAANQIIEGLEDGEFFNIIDYSDTINSYAEKPVAKTAETAKTAHSYINALQANGGTNIHDALLEALRPQPPEGTIPLVLFLTDGLPTVGTTGEAAIREAAKKGNKFERRIFSFGVGFDVNAPLLTGLSRGSRGASTFVLPEEDVEVKVSQVFRRLAGPVLAAPTLTATDGAGGIAARAVRDVMPAEIPDLFDGDQLVVMGRYTGQELYGGKLRVRLQGNYFGRARTFDFAFDVSNATTRNSFVPRLWATARIGALVEQIRLSGADSPGARPDDSKTKELVDEIVRLSTEYGILTEYTAFLATERADFRTMDGLSDTARGTIRLRAMGGREGRGAVNQELNATRMAAAKAAPSGGAGGERMQLSGESKAQSYYDENMKKVEVHNVQQVADQTLFFRKDRWVDARILAKENEAPDQTVEFGSPEYAALVDRFVAEGRQALLANTSDTYLLLDGKRILVKAP